MACSPLGGAGAVSLIVVFLFDRGDRVTGCCNEFFDENHKNMGKLKFVF